MSKLKRNLKIVWNEGTGPDSGRRRFHAKSLDGGTGWGVWDQKGKRFLKDREVAALSTEQIRETWVS